jgi:hypothetical protein
VLAAEGFERMDLRSSVRYVVEETAPGPATKALDRPRRPSSSLVQPVTPEQYNFRFAAEKEFEEKLERLPAVLAVENPVHSVHGEGSGVTNLRVGAGAANRNHFRTYDGGGGTE